MEHTLVFSNRQEWRNWLSQNHNRTDNVWLVFYKKCSTKKGLTLDEAVEEALSFGWIDSRQHNRDKETYMLRFSPRRAASVWSKINRERAERLIATGQMTPAGLAKVEEAKKTGQWDNAYTNQTPQPMPPDLEEALKKDAAVWNNFQGFANSYRNMYVYWVNQAKTLQTRQERIKTVVEQSQQNKKRLTNGGK
jgi:uncharacterized protein YdeI (YjbR/CyaY-like superfamily)